MLLSSVLVVKSERVVLTTLDVGVELLSTLDVEAVSWLLSLRVLLSSVRVVKSDRVVLITVEVGVELLSTLEVEAVN